MINDSFTFSNKQPEHITYDNMVKLGKPGQNMILGGVKYKICCVIPATNIWGYQCIGAHIRQTKRNNQRFILVGTSKSEDILLTGQSHEQNYNQMVSHAAARDLPSEVRDGFCSLAEWVNGMKYKKPVGRDGRRQRGS